MNNLPALLTLLITIIAAIFLVTELLRPDLIALIILVTLGLTRIVAPQDVFSGFGGSAVMTILAVSIISEALHQTGVTHRLGNLMYRFGRQSEGRLILATMLTSAGLSLFMNNIAVVGVLLPAVMGLSRRSKLAPSRLLLPLAFGTSLGGMATLLTTSNIIISGALHDAGYRPFGLLDFLPTGIPVVAVGVAYMLLVGRRWLPRRNPGEAAQAEKLPAADLAMLYGVEDNLCEVIVGEDSPLARQSIRDGQWASRLKVSVLGLARDKRFEIAPAPQTVVQPQDVVLCQGKPDVEQLRGLGLSLKPSADGAAKITGEAITLSEIVLSPHTTLIGKTLKDYRFRERFKLNALAIWREGKPIQSDLANLPMRFGDALLVQGMASQVKLLHGEREFIVLEEDPDAAQHPNKANLALWITLLTLGVASLGIFPVAVVALAGVILLLLTQCLGMNDAYRAIEWKAVFLIAGMWPLSLAIRDTGLAQQGIDAVLRLAGSIPPLAMAGILLVVAMGLTQIIGGQVTSIVVAPVAIIAGRSLGIAPYSLAMAAALGCSLAFSSPYGHPVNLMVMSPGGYRFKDYVRVGLPLTVLAAVTILVGLHFFWGV